MPQEKITPADFKARPLTRAEQDAFARLWVALKMKKKPIPEREALRQKVFCAPARLQLMKAMLPKQSKAKDKLHARQKVPFTKPEAERTKKREEASRKRAETRAKNKPEKPAVDWNDMSWAKEWMKNRRLGDSS